MFSVPSIPSNCLLYIVSCLNQLYFLPNNRHYNIVYVCICNFVVQWNVYVLSYFYCKGNKDNADVSGNSYNNLIYACACIK